MSKSITVILFGIILSCLATLGISQIPTGTASWKAAIYIGIVLGGIPFAMLGLDKALGEEKKWNG